ncbi:hypothetical protein HHK36_022025 [Tetracentron sinense]|uniref:Uncharacterized protein n=1 Tax=Tetracentron sinense TaxID=13715 RepID=A0A834YUC4_TETSI|nr:hypothetical protein HHK36_022025 [Tetracentron sinense]
MHEDDRMIEDSVTMEPDAEVNNEEDEKDKRIRELSLELHRSKQREDEYKERLDKLLKDIARHTNNITKSVQDVVNNVKEIESKGGKDH